jgi:hypothetical protein
MKISQTIHMRIFLFCGTRYSVLYDVKFDFLRYYSLLIRNYSFFNF